MCDCPQVIIQYPIVQQPTEQPKTSRLKYYFMAAALLFGFTWFTSGVDTTVTIKDQDNNIEKVYEGRELRKAEKEAEISLEEVLNEYSIP